MTELDKLLQTIASSNWKQFVDIIGEDAILNAKICLLRQQKKSYGEISVKLSITRDTVIYRCEKCDCSPVAH